MEQVLYLVETRPTFYGLVGNHELQYMTSNQDYWTSQYHPLIIDYILTHNLREKMQNVLVESLEVEHSDGRTILFTHAGVSKTWFETLYKTEEGVDVTVDDVVDVLKNCGEKMYDIGTYRGGYARCGGPLWCDYNVEFVPIPGITQVFGHTRHRKTGDSAISTDGENWCIDCLMMDDYILEINEDGFKAINVNDI